MVSAPCSRPPTDPKRLGRLPCSSPPPWRWAKAIRQGGHSLKRCARIWDLDLPDDEWVVNFLKAVGSDPDEFPPEFLTVAKPLVPLLRHARPIWTSDLPLAELAAAPFPKLVVSGGHSAGFDAICDELAERIGASRAVAAGAGHEVQFSGAPINEALLSLWRTA